MPPSEQPSAPDPHRFDEYHKQLGYFISAFGQVEADLFVCLILMAGVSLPVGRAIFSGTRAKEASNFMKRISQVRDDLPKGLVSVLTRCLDQIGVINDMRNQLVHHGIVLAESEPILTSNWVRALSEDRHIAYSVTSKTVHNMSTDLMTISAALQNCAGLLAKPPLEGVREDISPPAWLYKPPQLASRSRKTSGSDPKRPPPPGSSSQ